MLAAVPPRGDDFVPTATLCPSGPDPITRCRNGHLVMWRTATEDTLILEDDVTFAPGWQDALERALAEVPSDWDLLYLGGEHQSAPEPITATLARCTATHRTHAYVVRASSASRIEAVVSAAPTEVRHVDGALAWAQRSGLLTAYAMTPWVAGQAAGRSYITGQQMPERWWHW